jgi:hypothetical protein
MSKTNNNNNSNNNNNNNNSGRININTELVLGRGNCCLQWVRIQLSSFPIVFSIRKAMGQLDNGYSYNSAYGGIRKACVSVPECVSVCADM